MLTRSLYCKTCGTPFETLAIVLDTRKSRYEPVFCPLGHEQHEGEDELGRMKAKAQREEERANKNWDECQRLARRITSLRGVITRMKKARKKAVPVSQ